MWREGSTVTGRGYYILGSNRHDFYNISTRESRVSKYHQMILSELRGCGERYRRGRSHWTNVAPIRVPIQEEDEAFTDLQKEVKNSP